MNKLSILISLLLFSFFAVAQNRWEFTFDIKFETNAVSINYHDEFSGPNYNFKLEKYKSSCKFGKIEYFFQEKDSLLLRYFSDLKKLFEQPNFYRNFKKTCPELLAHKKYDDGGQTIFWYKSDSTKISYGAVDGICDYNSLYDSIKDNFFNIVIYLVNQPSSIGKFSESQLSALEYLEGNTGLIPIRLVYSNPLTYRLKGRAYERSYKEVLNILNELPKDKPTYIEVSESFDVNECDSFYMHFKDFLKKPNKIVWIPENDKIADKLKELGVTKKSMKTIRKKSK